ncbi:MAG: helix-turn-helix domain-containing protein [Ignavibacteria bacterium]|nr:helix-turn-helix domain-containing protein [Ignavibacteria bacterium]
MTILNPNLPEVLTKIQLAEYLRVSSMSILRYENEGAFKHFSRDKQNARLYRKSDVETYLQSLNQKDTVYNGGL